MQQEMRQDARQLDARLELGMHRDHISYEQPLSIERGTIPEGKRDDPWACFYGTPSTGQSKCPCGYCRDGLDCCPANAKYSENHRLSCGHPIGRRCACVKVRREPISETEAFALLARSN